MTFRFRFSIRDQFLIVFLILLSAYFYKETIFLYPNTIHAWTQFDKYALSLGFLENGFDFFHPTQYNLEAKNGITRVDFPIHEYLIALVMKVSGNTSPLVYRLYMLTYSLIGLFFLYKLTYLLTRSHLKSYLTVIFTFAAPVFTYYQAGFLPTTTSLASTFIAYYFYFNFRKNKKEQHFYISILFFTLAALSRLPFAIFLIATFIHYLWDLRKSHKIQIKKVSTYLAGFACIGAYFIYNNYLEKTYGSIFLSYPVPPKNFEDLKKVIIHVYEHWTYHYYTVFHYYLLGGLIAIAVLSSKAMKSIFNDRTGMGFQFIITLIGASLYAILMAYQYINHDYYFIDTFFLPIILLLIFLLKTARKSNWALKTVFFIYAFIFPYHAILASKEVQNERYQPDLNNRSYITFTNFEDSEDFLKQENVAPEAKIMVIDAYSRNMPLVMMKRKGYTVLNTKKEFIINFLQYDFDYVVIQNEFLLSDVILQYPEIICSLDKIRSNGKITLYSYKKRHCESEINREALLSFIDINDNNVILKDSLKSFVLPDLIIQDNGSFISNDEYCFTYRTKSTESLKNKKYCFLNWEGRLKCPNLTNAKLIVSIAGSESPYYKTIYLKEFFTENDGYKNLAFEFKLPELNGKEEIGAYIYNPGKEDIMIENIEIVIYQSITE